MNASLRMPACWHSAAIYYLFIGFLTAFTRIDWGLRQRGCKILLIIVDMTPPAYMYNTIYRSFEQKWRKKKNVVTSFRVCVTWECCWLSFSLINFAIALAKRKSKCISRWKWLEFKVHLDAFVCTEIYAPNLSDKTILFMEGVWLHCCQLEPCTVSPLCSLCAGVNFTEKRRTSHLISKRKCFSSPWPSTLSPKVSTDSTSHMGTNGCN